MPILVCRCGNPAHNTLALMLACYRLMDQRIIPLPPVETVDFGRN